MATETGGKILLVDDEEIFRIPTVGILEREGHQCDSAVSASEALKYLEQPYDLLIVDINMPGNVDLEFVKELRQCVPLLPIIIVTGYPSVPTAVESLHLSVVDYFVKPLKISDFLQSVMGAVAKGRVVRTIHHTQQITQEWGREMDQLQDSIDRGKGREGSNGLEWTLDRYLEKAMGNIARLAFGMQNALHQMGKERAEISMELCEDVCELVRCPRLVAYESILQETVQVLEKTKRAFKSKALGAIRDKIEILLNTSNETGAPQTQNPKSGETGKSHEE